jgi:YD repeat-containing protein
MLFINAALGPKWTFDWLSYIKDNPLSSAADVKYYILGGGTRTFTGFDPATQTYAFQQYDQTRLTRTSPTSYEMVSPDGSRKIFSQPDGSIGTSRKIFLTRIIDPAGNTVSLTYDNNLRLIALTDAIGQVTTIAYTHPTDIYKITKVTDPFGRSALFEYDVSGRLAKITDVIGLTSQFTYDGPSDFINALITP